MSDWFTIRKDVPPWVRWAAPFITWGGIVLLWILLPYWEGPHFSLLPTPIGVIRSFKMLWTDYDLLGNVFMSWWRIAQAFLWSAAIAIPLGLLMGSFRWLHSFINPIAEPMRSMPITAFVPAFIGLFGMEEGMKVGFLFFGMFFYLLALVVEEADRVDQALLETAMTLGAKKRQLLWLMFRASFPAIFGSFRILYDIGWTYVILAEMVNARKGVGYMVEAARKVLDFDRMYAGIIAIGFAAFLFRWLLTVLERQLFPWRRPASQSSAHAIAKVAAKAHSHA